MHTTQTVWVESFNTLGYWTGTMVRPQCSCGWHGTEVDMNRSADADDQAIAHEDRYDWIGAR